jgi:hypothetical protein
MADQVWGSPTSKPVGVEGGGRYRCANISPTLIVCLWFYTHTHWSRPDITHRSQLLVTQNGVRTARDVVAVVWLSWLRRACRRQLEQATLPERWRWFHHLVAVSHTLPARAAWPLPGPDLVITKGARSPEAKQPCGSFPQGLFLSVINHPGLESDHSFSLSVDVLKLRMCRALPALLYNPSWHRV